MMEHNGDWAYGPLMKVLAFAVLRPRVATFPEKSQAAHSETFNKAFNAADLLFNSPVCEAPYCFFLVSASIVSKQLL